MNPSLGIDSIIFDLFHTLVAAEDHRPDGFSYRHDIIDMLEYQSQDFLSFWDETYYERETNPIDLVDLVARYHRAKGREPFTDEQRSELDRLFGVAKDDAMLLPRPEVVELLATLEPRVSIGVLSNCHERETRRWPQSPLAPMVDATVRSCDVGVMKPEPAIYQAVLDALGADAGAAIYVGNGNGDELAGARRAGFAVIVHMNGFDRPYRLVDEAEQQRRRYQADHSVESVADLRTVLLDLTDRPGR